MHIVNVEMTPNPNARKFVLSEPIVSGGARQFESPPSTGDDALAAALFALPGVSSVFYLDNFVTVDRVDGDWDHVRQVLASALESGLRPGADGPQVAGASAEDPEMLAKINNVLDQMVRPALAGDGGGLRVVGLRGQELYIHYEGACGSCPSSTAGTMFAIQNLLRAEVSDQLTVIAA